MSFIFALNEGNSWSQDTTGGILCSLLTAAVFRLSSDKLDNIAHAHAATHEPFLISRTFQHFLFTSATPSLPFPCLGCVETATGVFPQSCSYSLGKRVILSAYSRISGCVNLCLCSCVRVCVWLTPVIFCQFQGFPCCWTQTFPIGVTMRVKVCMHAFQCFSAVIVSFSD